MVLIAEFYCSFRGSHLKYLLLLSARCMWFLTKFVNPALGITWSVCIGVVKCPYGLQNLDIRDLPVLRKNISFFFLVIFCGGHFIRIHMNFPCVKSSLNQRRTSHCYLGYGALEAWAIACFKMRLYQLIVGISTMNLWTQRKQEIFFQRLFSFLILDV